MVEDLLRLLIVYHPSNDRRVDEISKGLKQFSIDSMTLPIGEALREDWKDLLDESDAVAVALEHESADLLTSQEDFQRLVRSAGAKAFALLVDDEVIPPSLSHVLTYALFESSTIDEAALERFTYWLRETVEMRREVEQSMPEESLKKAPEPPEEEPKQDEPDLDEPADTDADVEADSPLRGRTLVYVASAMAWAAIGLFFAGNYLNRSIPDLSDGILDEDEALRFVLVRPTPYRMGSGAGDEQPQHDVNLVDPFLVSEHEVSFGVYQRYLDSAETRQRPAAPFAGDTDPDWPVVNVSFVDAVKFADWYGDEKGATYRLPSEAEWEWLARQTELLPANLCGLVNFRGDAETACSNAPRGLVRVDAYAQDSLGLYHLYGNAAEWVQDCYAQNYPDSRDDGSPNESGDCAYRVYRGGSWLSEFSTITPTYRAYASPDYRDFHLGFRLVRELDSLDVFTLNRPTTDWNRVLPAIRYSAYVAAAILVFLAGWLINRRRERPRPAPIE